MKKNCKNCGTEFEAKDKRKLYCSHNCKSAYGMRKVREREPLYATYSLMIQRCFNINNPRYEDYGGRGITVCDQWADPIHGFANFKEDMGERPEGYTMDRLDVDKEYSPKNCRWASNKQQRANQRVHSNAVLIEHPCGLIASVGEWAALTGVPYQRIWQRYKAGWSVERIFNEQPRSTR